MKTPKQLPHPQFTSAVQLSAIELNRLRFCKGRTVLTPARLHTIVRQPGAPTAAHPPLTNK